jgi:hypothetical protein
VNTTEELVFRLAARAAELADKPLDDLRASYPATTTTREELVSHCKAEGYSRGSMIQAILVAEFHQEN